MIIAVKILGMTDHQCSRKEEGEEGGGGGERDLLYNTVKKLLFSRRSKKCYGKCLLL